MRTLKKNQIVVFVIGLMIITAGYLSYSNNSDGANNGLLEASMITDSEEMASIGDARLVSANVADSNTIGNNIATNTITGIKDNITNDVENDKENANNVLNSVNVENSSANIGTEKNSELSEDENNIVESQTVETSSTQDDGYFTNSRLERNTLYSQQIENYQDILNNTNVSEAQKQIAQEEITRINNEQNAIMITENLIKTKGIEDLIIFVNGDSINVIVKGENLNEEKIAQIQNIVTRELEAEIEDIHIMSKD